MSESPSLIDFRRQPSTAPEAVGSLFPPHDVQQLITERTEVGQEMAALRTISNRHLRWTGVLCLRSKIQHMTTLPVHADHIHNPSELDA